MTLLEIRALAILALVVGLLAGGWALVHSIEVRGAAKLQAEVTAAALKATTEARAEEQRRIAAQSENANETQRLATRARTDAAGVAAVAPSLRAAVVARIGAAACNPAIGASVAPAASGPDLLADVLGKAEDRLRALAEIADERGIAGASCERAYDSLTPPIGLGHLKLGSN